MIVLDNYSKWGTCIILDDAGYSIIQDNEVANLRNGEGGFSEDDDILGIYIKGDKFYFFVNDKKYLADPSRIRCTNPYIDKEKRRFMVEMDEKIICDITYKPYIKPNCLAFGDDPNEFDFLGYLSDKLKDRQSIEKFITGINNLNSYYKGQ